MRAPQEEQASTPRRQKRPDAAPTGRRAARPVRRATSPPHTEADRERPSPHRIPPSPYGPHHRTPRSSRPRPAVLRRAQIPRPTRQHPTPRYPRKHRTTRRPPTTRHLRTHPQIPLAARHSHRCSNPHGHPTPHRPQPSPTRRTDPLVETTPPPPSPHRTHRPSTPHPTRRRPATHQPPTRIHPGSEQRPRTPPHLRCRFGRALPPPFSTQGGDPALNGTVGICGTVARGVAHPGSLQSVRAAGSMTAVMCPGVHADRR